MLRWLLLLLLLLPGLMLGVTGILHQCRDLLLIRCDTFPKHLICASNGITYDNDCEYASAVCMDPSIHAVRRSSCTTSKPVAEVVLALACPDVSHVDCDSQPSDVVCGNDGKEYDNMCHFEKARCTDHSLHEKPLPYCRIRNFIFSWSDLAVNGVIPVL